MSDSSAPQRRRMNLHVFADAAAVAKAGAKLLLEEAELALRSKGRFTLALAGGSTPRLLYETLAAHDGASIDWSRTHVFWGDERCVPATHPESNAAMADEVLLSKVDIPPENVHRMNGELADPREAAREYDLLLKEFFGAAQATLDPQPRNSSPAQGKTFDFLLLGMGKDGHTASLFPGDAALREGRKWALAIQAPPGMSPRDRISLTLPPIFAAGRCVFLVTGERKRRVLSAIRNDPTSAASLYPAARIAMFRESIWLTDSEAAGTPPS